MQPTAIWRQLLFDQQTKSHVPIGRNWQGCTASICLAGRNINNEVTSYPCFTLWLTYWLLQRYGHGSSYCNSTHLCQPNPTHNVPVKIQPNPTQPMGGPNPRPCLHSSTRNRLATCKYFSSVYSLIIFKSNWIHCDIICYTEILYCLFCSHWTVFIYV